MLPQSQGPTLALPKEPGVRLHGCEGMRGNVLWRGFSDRRQGDVIIDSAIPDWQRGLRMMHLPKQDCSEPDYSGCGIAG